MLLDSPVIETLATDIGAYVFRDESILGTRMQIQLVASTFTVAQEAALAVRAEIDRLNLILNSRNPTSELYALNRSSVHRASPELFAVIALAERWREATAGAFSGRLGRAIEVWQRAVATPPSRAVVAQLAQQAQHARVTLHPATRTIGRPAAVKFALDGLAKGWIVDRAFQAALTWPGVRGALIDIGGDVRCGGQSPDNEGWRVGVADPRRPFDNAPIVAEARLREHAMATSGRGPRDRVIADRIYSPTLSPHDGWPIAHHVSSTVIAECAATADALATALLVLPEERALALAEAHGAPARITTCDYTPRWSPLAQVTPSSAQFTAMQVREAATNPASATNWQDGWQALATFTAPRRQLLRDPQFRSPYMAMWITDRDNAPIRTLLLVGKRADWQKDNFIWWSMNRTMTERLVATRSMSTSGAGVYNVFWDGVDDAGRSVPAGEYVLHVETSRERGQHTYRSLKLDFAKFQRFVEVLAPSEEGGGLRVSFDHY